MDNNIFSENFSSYILRLWRKKFYIGMLVFLTMLGSAIYSLSVDEKYLVYASFYPASANDETVLNPNSNLVGFSLGKVSNQIIINIMLNLSSDTFWKPFYDKYRFNEKLFGEDLIKAYKEETDSIIAEEIMLNDGLKILKEEVIKFSHDTDYDLMKISATLKDKYFARDFLYEVLDSLQKTLYKANMSSLTKDLAYYNDLREKVSDPVVKNRIEKAIANKLEKQYIMTNNQFKIIREIYIPHKRIYPKRTSFCLTNGFLAFIFCLFLAAISPAFLSVYNIIKSNKK